MSVEEQRETRIQFWGRPGEIICPELANSWLRHGLHGRESTAQPGRGRIVALDTQTAVQYYIVEEAVLYSDEYTKQTWPPRKQRRKGQLSRSEEIDLLESGEAIGYPFWSLVIPYTKTVGAENIQITTLRAVDNFGQPLPGDGNLLTSGQIGPRIGMTKENNRALWTPFNFRGEQAFLLAVGMAEISEERLRSMEEEVFGTLDLNDNPQPHPIV